MNVNGLEFPDALHYHVEHQTWARVAADGSVTVGITSMGIQPSGEIYMWSAGSRSARRLRAPLTSSPSRGPAG